MMRAFCIVLMVFVVVVVLSFVMAFILTEIEIRTRKKQDKLDAEYNAKMETGCAAAKLHGSCPHDCRKCYYGTRKKNGIIRMGYYEFR